MLYKEKIINYMENNQGYITNQILKKLKIPTIYLTRMINEGTIDRVSRGIYILSNLLDDELYVNYLRYKKIIYTGNTALVLNNMSNKSLKMIEANVPANYNPHRIKTVKIHRVNDLEYMLGKTFKKTDFGNNVPCYDIERIICEILINNILDKEALNYALKQAKNQDLDHEKLYIYANKLNIYDKIKLLFEVWL